MISIGMNENHCNECLNILRLHLIRIKLSSQVNKHQIILIVIHKHELSPVHSKYTLLFTASIQQFILIPSHLCLKIHYQTDRFVKACRISITSNVTVTFSASECFLITVATL